MFLYISMRLFRNICYENVGPMIGFTREVILMVFFFSIPTKVPGSFNFCLWFFVCFGFDLVWFGVCVCVCYIYLRCTTRNFHT